jgi:hypothetical protein
MPSPKTTSHPLAIWYETKNRIKNIETADQNLAQIIVEKRKIKGEKSKKIVDLLKERTLLLLTTGREAGGEGNRGRRRRRRSRPKGEGADGPEAMCLHELGDGCPVLTVTLWSC